MDSRRFRNQSPAETLARVRWLGWVMLMMFVLVQTATGADAAAENSQRSRLQDSASSPAVADFNPETHQVTLKAAVPAAAWDATADIGRHSFVVYEDNVRQPTEAVEVAHVNISTYYIKRNNQPLD